MELSLFHSVLIYRQNYTSITQNAFGAFCNWTIADIATVIDSFKLVSRKNCPENTDVAHLVASIYGSRCLSANDMKWIQETAKSLLSSVNNPKEASRHMYRIYGDS